MMTLDGVYTALSTELQRWSSLRSEAMASLQAGATEADTQLIKKSLVGEFNAHIRRIDSLWRQFSDDYKRDKTHLP